MAFNLSKKPVYFIPAWKGNRECDDPISVELRRMSLQDFWILTSTLESIQRTIGSKEPAVNKPSEMVRLSGELKSVLEKYVTNIKNLTIDDRVASISDLIEDPGFLELILEFVTELSRINSLDDMTKKKSDGSLQKEIELEAKK